LYSSIWLINVLVEYSLVSLTTTFRVTSKLAIFHACPAQDSSNAYTGATSTILVPGIMQGIQDTT
jgi:hypothetical protein